MSDTPHCYRHPNRETLVSCSECGRPICEDCMTFAPVGIRCPEHANMGAPASSPARTVRTARRRVASHAAPATMTLIGLNVLVYVITVVNGVGLNDPQGRLYYRGALFVSNVFLPGEGLAYGEWWRILTATFLHASLLHIGMNMLVLYMLGMAVEQALGTGRFVMVYVASGIAGSAGAILLSPNAPTVGASGAIYGIMGSLLVLEYMATGSFAGQAMGFIVINLAITFAIPGISIGGHLGGLTGGIIATYALARTRFSPNAALGPALVAGVALVSIGIAYARVRGYA
jgi:membrane associated rhomboid family serine protease